MLKKLASFFSSIIRERRKLTFLHVFVVAPDAAMAWVSAKLAEWTLEYSVGHNVISHLPAWSELGLEICGAFCWFVISKSIYSILVRAIAFFIPVYKGRGKGDSLFSVLRKRLTGMSITPRDGPGAYGRFMSILKPGTSLADGRHENRQ